MTTEIYDALTRLAHRLRGPSARLLACKHLSGGASLETWAFEIGEKGASERMILRRRADISSAAVVLTLDLRTEALLLQAALAHAVPLPGVAHVCDESDGLGEAIILRFIEGEALGRKIVGDSRFNAIRPRLAGQCGRILSSIHCMAVPVGAVLPTERAREVLARYEALYRASDLQRPVLELAFQHLRRSAPSDGPAVLLHGDFRNGNFLVDASRGIVAVLDWELAHRGDAAEDLGWLCVNSWRFGHPERPVGGFGDYEMLLEAYAATGTEPPSLSRLRYWQAMGSLKWAVMCLGMYNSWASGKTRSLERPMIGRRISETEIDLLNLLEAGL